MYSEIAANKRKTWLIMFVFVVMIGLIAYFLSVFWFNSPSTTVAILVMAMIYASFSFFSGGKMAIALNGGKEVTDTNDRLYRTVENLSITTGLPMPKVYIIDDPGMNAFATGRDPEHSMVAATSGLVNGMTDAELEGVMAHELGHIQNYDIRVMMIAFALVAVVAVISDVVMRSIWFGDNDNRGGGGAAIIIGIVVIILAPIAAQLLKMSVSRKREYLADATGALTTRYPEGLASALEKLKGQSTLKKQNTATAHLFIANPLKGKGMSKMFSTHPPIDDRIAKLREMETKL